MAKIYPSLLSADFGKMLDEVKAVEEAGADGLHFDVMDGHFVPNISFGAPVLKWLKGKTKLELDCHLMVTEPRHLFTDFAKAGAERITIHTEACKSIEDDLKAIRDLGMKAGLAIKPNTPFKNTEKLLPYIDLFLSMTVNPGFGGQALIPEALSKTKDLIDWLKDLELKDKIQVQIDGGVNAETAPKANALGIDILVAGNAVFGGTQYKEKIAALKKI
ncbi:MAG: ribulose-phosphate 3-epimerase [Bdellovibrionota bacterium]